MITKNIKEIRIGKKLAQPLYEIDYLTDNRDDTGERSSRSITLHPGIPSKGDIINAIVRDQYPTDKMEAVTNNYMQNLSDMTYASEFMAMQQWRCKAKEIACEALLVINDGNDDFDRLDMVRQLIRSRIENYDISDNVDAFLINGRKHWMPKPVRESLVMTLREFEKAGIQSFPFELDGNAHELPCIALSGMVTEVEVYATQCMAVTKRHLAVIETLATESELMEYDFTVGYHGMPNFEIDFINND